MTFWVHIRARDQHSSLGKVGSSFRLKGKYDFSGVEMWGKHSRQGDNTLSQVLEGKAWNRRQRERVLESKCRFILRYLCKNGRDVTKGGHGNKGGLFWDRRET